MKPLTPHTCKSIHEGRKRSVEHLKEWISNRIPLWAAQSSVFQNMGNSCTVHWSSPESYTEVENKDIDKYTLLSEQILVALYNGNHKSALAW